ncbi:unnamed protein product, partial [Ixodes pacificus]
RSWVDFRLFLSPIRCILSVFRNSRTNLSSEDQRAHSLAEGCCTQGTFPGSSFRRTAFTKECAKQFLNHYVNVRLRWHIRLLYRELLTMRALKTPAQKRGINLHLNRINNTVYNGFCTLYCRYGMCLREIHS